MNSVKRWFIVAVLVAGSALGYLAFGGIGENLVYYWTPTEMAAHGTAAQGAVIRLGGVVEPGSLVYDKSSSDLRFSVSDGTTAVKIEGRSVPPQMFREGIGVVVEGTLRADGVFTSERLLVKHDNQYQAPAEGEAPNLEQMRTTLSPES